MSDPTAMLRAARAFARPVAWGLLGRARVLEILTNAAAQAAPNRCTGGMRARLAHALDDAVGDIVRSRALAWWRVRAALAPLLDQLASRAELLQVGFAAAGETMTPTEARALIEHAVRAHLRTAPGGTTPGRTTPGGTTPGHTTPGHTTWGRRA
jgi:hypothetical protein